LRDCDALMAVHAADLLRIERLSALGRTRRWRE